MVKPTPAEINDWSQLNFARYGFTDDTKLQVVIDRATAYVLWVTGQTLPNLDASVSPTGNPLDLEPIMGQAIQMRVEQVALQGRVGYVGSAAELDVISSFTAGSYSESRRQPGAKPDKSINKWPALEELLWMLMTPERFAYWYAYVSGEGIPNVTVEEIAWVGGMSGSARAIEWFQPWDRFVPAGDGFA